MSTGVLLYCFNTPEVAYHKFAEKCIKLIRKNLKLSRYEITIVTNFSTFEQFDDISGLNIKLVENKTGNKRPYRGKNISWNNLERSLAYEHSPYDTTILMDVDYFCFTDNLLELDVPSLQKTDGYYRLEYLHDYTQTFATIRANTNSTDEYQKLVWVSNKEILIDGYWINLVNKNSYTDNDGYAYTVLGVWEEFLGDTVTVYCGYKDMCLDYIDSLKVIIE